ncbi:hypothetical protein CK203_011625 [Vitis vinifera]|uniref:Mitochondrial protein n=1 Tax=Vitis vinifera TaxID=29760 RepID=A0A438JUF1_VITVI|nr:hypothetical protein CK203_011625 [Vitis vinifera]
MWSLFRSGFTSATSNHSSDLYDHSPSHLTHFESEPVQKNQLQSLSIETEQSPSSSSLDKSSNSSKATLQIQSLETEHKRPEAPNFNVYSRRKRSIIPAHPPISETLTDAMNEELQASEKNKSWEVIDLPERKKTMGCGWIYNIKYKADGTIERLKQTPRTWLGRFTKSMVKKGHRQSQDWVGSMVDRRSTTRHCTFPKGNLVTWRSKKQPVVARSSAEVEFSAMAQGICELL